MMRTTFRLISVISCFAVISTIVGCGSNDHPKLGLVTGKVTWDREPLPNVEVVFRPEKGRSSIAMTDSDGQFEMNYARDIKGALLGSHNIFISSVEEEFAGREGTAVTKKQQKIPKRYNTQTILHETVKAGKNHFVFELKSK